MAVPGSETGVSEIEGFLGAICTVFAIVVVKVWHAWINEKGVEPQPARQVILQQAELADLGETTRLMRDITPKLSAIYDIDETNRRFLEGNRELMSECIRILRRLEGEIDVAKRIREERLLETQREREAR